MIMGYFFCLSAAFVLAKFVRDNEKARAEGRSADTPMFRFVVWGAFFLASEPGRSMVVEYRMFTNDGRLVWVKNEAVLERDRWGRPALCRGVMLDITARKRAEEHGPPDPQAA